MILREKILEGAWLCQHLDLRLLGLRSVIEPTCVHPEETIEHRDAGEGEASLRVCGVSFSGPLLLKQMFAELLTFIRHCTGPQGWR